MIRFEYDESEGINLIPLPQPVPSNILLLRGDYLTITVAVFGFPFFPALQQTGLAVPNFSVPPPPFVPSGSGYPSMGSIQPPLTSQVSAVSLSQNWPDSSKIQPQIDIPSVSKTSGSSSALLSLMVKEEPLATVANEPQPDKENKDVKESEYEQESSNEIKVPGKEVNEEVCFSICFIIYFNL